MMARIIRYDGNLQARVSQSDSRFCNMVLKELIDTQIVKLPLSSKKFSIQGDEEKTRLTIYVKKMTLFSKDEFKPNLKEIVKELEVETNGINGNVGQPKYDPSRI